MLKKRDPIEKILLDSEKITEKTLEEIRQNEFQKGKYLGKVLVDHGYIRAQDLLETLSEELGYPYVKQEDFNSDTLPYERCIFYTGPKPWWSFPEALGPWTNSLKPSR